MLADGTEVAVKTLSAKSYQGKQEFLNEAALITAVQHRSLVKLKGCCLERDHRILVYEYMENKSLHQTLFGEFCFIHVVLVDILIKSFANLKSCFRPGQFPMYMLETIISLAYAGY